MKEQKIRFTPIPSTAEVEAERERLAYRSRYMRVLRSTVYTLLVVAAVAVLLATLFLPVLQVSGDLESTVEAITALNPRAAILAFPAAGELGEILAEARIAGIHAGLL